MNGNSHAAGLAHDVNIAGMKTVLDTLKFGVAKSENAGQGVRFIGGDQVDRQLP